MVSIIENEEQFRERFGREPSKIEKYYLENGRGVVFVEKDLPGIDAGIYPITSRPSYLERDLLILVEGVPDTLKDKFYEKLRNRDYKGAWEVIENSKKPENPETTTEPEIEKPRSLGRRGFFR